MSKSRIFRDYIFPDSDLHPFTHIICNYVRRDIADFEVYGITNESANELEALSVAFEEFRTDIEIYGNYLEAVEKRNNIINDLQKIIKSMAMRTELKWGKKSPKYRSLGIKDLSVINVESYATRARTIHGFMTENLSELVTEGLTQTILDNFETKIQELNAAINQVMEKESQRKEMTIERITKGNEIYKLVSKYCEIGKRIWSGVNPAKYKEYVIYKNLKGKKEEVAE